MGEFRTNSSQELNVGATAQEFVLPTTQDAAHPGEGPKVRHASHAMIENTHATQDLFVRRGAAATTSVFDLVVPAGSMGVISLSNADSLSIIASGASTTGALHWGSAL